MSYNPQDRTDFTLSLLARASHDEALRIISVKDSSTVQIRQALQCASNKRTSGSKIGRQTIDGMQPFCGPRIGHERDIQVAVAAAQAQQKSKNITVGHTSIKPTEHGVSTSRRYSQVSHLVGQFLQKYSFSTFLETMADRTSSLIET